MGVLSPIGINMEEFEKNLMAGVCGVGFITHFDASTFKVKVAAELKDYVATDYFEKNEARKMDLYTQYALVAAEQAVKSSGIVGSIDPERFGVYIGSGIGGMDTFITQTEKLLTGGERKVSPFFIPMMISNMASGTVAIKYGARGPCLPIVTACSTSTNEIGEAFRAIKHGYADAIITGGAEATVNPLAVAGFTNMTALSTKNIPEEASIPFDARRDGFVIGEGSAVLVLEEWEHAKARGAKIYAEMLGYGNSCDAYHITAPHPEAEGATAAIRNALKEAGYQEDMKVYYNAHGTSTPLNDKAETVALKKVFGEKAREISISSTKSMTGHMLGAAGAIEAIACILALETGKIPPTVGYRESDPDCDLDYTPNHAAEAQIDIAVSSSLGFGGHNATIVMRKGE